MSSHPHHILSKTNISFTTFFFYLYENPISTTAWVAHRGVRKAIFLFFNLKKHVLTTLALLAEIPPHISIALIVELGLER